MADACLTAIGVETSAQGVLELYGADLLNGWLVAEEDASTALDGVAVEAAAAADVVAGGDPRPGGGGPGPRWESGGMSTDGAASFGMITISGVPGLPEIGYGDDIAALIAKAAPGLADGDVVVVTSKIVSKAEGRRGARRRPRGGHRGARPPGWWRGGADDGDLPDAAGFVMAAAGVDASNTAPGTVLLLPEDPDASASAIRRRLLDVAGVRVGVIVSDTFGRPWRFGLTDVALGASGVQPLEDLRGTTDTYGNPLNATVTALIDEIAAAAELVKGKLSGVPVAVVSGLGHLVTDDDGPGARR